MFVSGINVWHNERRDLRQAAKEAAERNAQAAKEAQNVRLKRREKCKSRCCIKETGRKVCGKRA